MNVSVITQRNNQPASQSYLYSATPREGLRQVAATCAFTLDLLERLDLSPQDQKRLTAAWRYVSSFVRFVNRCYAFPDLNRNPTEIRHMYYVMLPTLLKQHIPTTRRALRDAGVERAIWMDWQARWSRKHTSSRTFVGSLLE